MILVGQAMRVHEVAIARAEAPSLEMCIRDRRYEINPVAERALDVLFTLHADHEQNASTSTVRLAGSSGTNPYAAIAAGIACLWGPAHGGANEAVIRMLDEIGQVSNIDGFIAKVKDKNSGVRLMGFGHRVYKNFDPRARIIKDIDVYKRQERAGCAASCS